MAETSNMFFSCSIPFSDCAVVEAAVEVVAELFRLEPFSVCRDGKRIVANIFSLLLAVRAWLHSIVSYLARLAQGMQLRLEDPCGDCMILLMAGKIEYKDVLFEEKIQKQRRQEVLELRRSGFSLALRPPVRAPLTVSKPQVRWF